jgi:hypothetical protein
MFLVNPLLRVLAVAAALFPCRRGLFRRLLEVACGLAVQPSGPVERGHPDLAAYTADVTGDPRDEVILWDQERVWIYSQDQPFQGNRMYVPDRSPHYNESNYRATVSLPHWQATR